MGGACSGDARRRRHSSRMVHSSTTEPLLRENEREAVSNLLRYLEQGGCLPVYMSVALHENKVFKRLVQTSQATDDLVLNEYV